MTPEIRVRREDWADPDIALPAYETTGAAGADVRANLPEDLRPGGLSVAPGARLLVPTGLRLEIPEDYEVQVRARSGLALKSGLGLANGVGTIDSDYRGPLGVIVVNLGDRAVRIAHGDRIAQLVVAPVVRASFAAVDLLSDSDRGSAGFGSTGRR